MSPGSIVISGASGGLGEALALFYAGPGTNLALIGRRGADLRRVADLCRDKGARVDEIVLDVRERDAMGERLAAFDRLHPVDLVIANAGTALPEEGPGMPQNEVIEINLLGALNTFVPLAPAMTARAHGQIALMSSLAAMAPLPDAAAYSASKAALLAYGLAMREKLRPAGLRVNVICPGFVATRMGAQYQGWRPFEISATAAARRIAAGLARNRAVIAFPRPLAAAARLKALLPEPLSRLATAGFRFSIASAGSRRGSLERS